MSSRAPAQSTAPSHVDLAGGGRRDEGKNECVWQPSEGRYDCGWHPDCELAILSIGKPELLDRRDLEWIDMTRHDGAQWDELYAPDGKLGRAWTHRDWDDGEGATYTIGVEVDSIAGVGDLLDLKQWSSRSVPLASRVVLNYRGKGSPYEAWRIRWYDATGRTEDAPGGATTRSGNRQTEGTLQLTGIARSDGHREYVWEGLGKRSAARLAKRLNRLGEGDWVEIRRTSDGRWSQTYSVFTDSLKWTALTVEEAAALDVGLRLEGAKVVERAMPERHIENGSQQDGR